MGDAGDRRRRPLTEIRSPARRPNPAHKATLTTLWFGDRQTHWKEKTIIASYAARGIKIKSVALKDGYGFLNFDTHKDADNFYGDYNGKSVHRNLQVSGETIKWNLRWPGKKEERRAQQPAAPSNSTLPPGLGGPDRAIEGLTSQAQGLESSPRQTNSRAEALRGDDSRGERRKDPAAAAARAGDAPPPPRRQPAAPATNDQVVAENEALRRLARLQKQLARKEAEAALPRAEERQTARAQTQTTPGRVQWESLVFR